MNEKTEKIWKELHFLSSIKTEIEGINLVFSSSDFFLEFFFIILYKEFS